MLAQASSLVPFVYLLSTSVAVCAIGGRNRNNRYDIGIHGKCHVVPSDWGAGFDYRVRWFDSCV